MMTHVMTHVMAHMMAHMMIHMMMAHVMVMVSHMMMAHMMMWHMARLRWHFAKCMSFATFLHYTLSAREMILMINYMFVNCCNMCWLYMRYDRMDVISAYIFLWWTKMWLFKLSWAHLWRTTMWFMVMMVMMMHTSMHGKTSCFDKLWFIINI